MGKCLLAIDIGNTAAKVGFYRDGRLLDFTSLANNDIPKYINKLLQSGKTNPIDIILSSVVPKITKKLKKLISKKQCVKMALIGNDIRIKLRHKYMNYNKLGLDRKVNSYGAIRMYRLPILIIGFGTAVTYDYIDAKGIFQGGLIVPGPEIAYSALLARGALLPKGRKIPSNSKAFPGRDTVGCLEAGILEGYGAMTDGLIQRFKTKYGSKIRVLATGGLAKTIAPYTNSIDIIDPKHSIKSLMVLWRDHIRKRPLPKSGSRS